MFPAYAEAPATNVPWGHKAFSNYLGEDRSTWEAYDASLLLKAKGSKLAILVDQGTKDGFLEPQLHPHTLETAAKQAGAKLELRMQEGYDHSYYFVSTFIGDHIAHHAKVLKA